MRTLAAYLALTKPRLLPLVLFSGLPVFWMASAGEGGWSLALATLVGTLLAAGAANTLNSYLERESDALMERTAMRPLASGLLAPDRALAFGLALGAAGAGLLLVRAGVAAAGIAVAAILFYVFAYTLWLKPHSRFAVVLGGLSGAVAPLIADAAIDGRVGAPGLLLFAIIFAWQPPHFYAIALYRRREYERAGFQVLPSRIGDDATRARIVIWVLAGVIPVSLAAGLFTPLGGIYSLSAIALGTWLGLESIALWRARRDAPGARRVFLVSLGYLGGLFTAMLIDLGCAGLGLSLPIAAALPVPTGW